MRRRTYIDSDGSELTVERNSDGVLYCNSRREYHRLDGPALECANGYKEWYQDGRLHRLDGPALEWADGTKIWFVDNKMVEPLFLVAYWLERGRCCWYDESTQELRFGDEG